MSKLVKIAQWATALLIITAATYTVYVIGRWLFEIFSTLDKTIDAALIAASATVLVSVLTIVLGKLYESNLHREKEIRERKVPIYERMLDFTFRFIRNAGTETPIPDSETKDFYNEFNQQFMIWGSDAVVAAWIAWRRKLLADAANKVTSTASIVLFEKLLFAIRRDLGHKNRGLGTGDILALFINDIDQYLSAEV